MAEEKLRDEHNAAGRRYPRPTETCDKCNEKITLCWGEVITEPYWRHGRGCGAKRCIGASESATHRLAKQFLVDHLVTGGGITMSRKCEKCGRYSETVLVPALQPPALHFATEVCDTPVACRWDVAGLNEVGDVVVGIEIFVTPSACRSGDVAAKWVEVEGADVLNKLDIKTRTEMITLRDLRPASSSPECTGCQKIAR